MNFRDFLPNQDPEESVFIFVRPYYLSFLPTLALGAALVIMGLIMIFLTVTNFPDLVGSGMGYNIFVIIVSAYFLTLLPFFTVVFLDYYYDIHIVTDRRIVDIDQNGLFNREINELALEDVQDVSSNNVGVLSSVYDFGNVSIETAGALPKFEFLGVHHPREIAAIVIDLSEQAKKRMGQPPVPLVPQSNAKGVINDKVINSLQQLADIGAMGSQAIVDHHLEPPRTPSTEPGAPSPEEQTAPKPPTAPPESDSAEKPSAESESDSDLDITIDEPPDLPKKPDPPK